MDIDQVSGAGGTIDVGGRMLTMTQLRFGDIGMVLAFVKERVPRPMQKAAQTIMDLLPLRESAPDIFEEMRREALLRAYEAESRGDADLPAAQGVTASLECAAYMLWLSVRRTHPDVTYEWLRGALDDEDLASVQDKLDLINRQWADLLPGKKGVPAPAGSPPGA